MILLKHENTGCPAWRLMAFLFILALLPPAQVQAAGANPFQACMTETDNDYRTCLARQGDWANWSASEAACRFIGIRVDAIVVAGGQAKWMNLFYNERCARLGLPHGPVAAAAGDKVTGGTWVVFDHPYSKCVYLDAGDRTDCNDSMGRHAYYPVRMAVCEGLRGYLLRDHQEQKQSREMLSNPFENERCWRLGYPHFEPD